jgi:hypothetical protein
MSYDSRVDTYEHIDKVRKYLTIVLDNIAHRALVHDWSKLEPPEREMFDEFTPKLRDLEYGSPEYKAATKAMGPALEHHYEHNPHHPEYYGERGIRGMSLLDLVEMLVDWQAASERVKSVRPPMPAAPGRPEAPQYDSNIERSILLNKERWGYSDELAEILINTARELRLI